MAQIKITFEKEINSSLQAKDIAYFSKTKSALTISEPSRLGMVVLIRRDLNYIVVDVDLTDPAITGFVAQDFVFFSKNISTNESSLKGYYAAVTFENNSNTRSELFAVSSEIALSSK
mgnify:CR=1 FL=1